MIKIRLSRHGSKKRPFYHIVAADSRMARDGRFIEKLGTFNPMLPKDGAQRLVWDLERVKYWLGTGAQATDRVHSWLAKEGLVKAKPQGEQTKQHKPKAKAVQRAEEKAAKIAEAEEARKAAEAEAKAAEEAAKEAAATAAAEAEAAPAEEVTEEAPVAEETPAEEVTTEEKADA